MKRRQKTGLLKNWHHALFAVAFFGVALVPFLSITSSARTSLSDRGLISQTSLPPMHLRPQDANTKPLSPFNEPIVTITFDDGWESVYSIAAPVMQQYGIRSTQYVLSDTSSSMGYMSSAKIKALLDGGHEIGCHGVSHRDLTKLDDPSLQNELYGCKTSVEKDLGISVKSFASPYSSINASTLFKTKQVFNSHRNTLADITNGLGPEDVNTAANYDSNNILSYAIRQDTTIEQIRAAVEYTIQTNSWLVLTYHQVEEDGAFALEKTKLEEQFSYLSAQNVRIAPISEVVEAIQAYQEGRF